MWKIKGNERDMSMEIAPQQNYFKAKETFMIMQREKI